MSLEAMLRKLNVLYFWTPLDPSSRNTIVRSCVVPFQPHQSHRSKYQFLSEIGVAVCQQCYSATRDYATGVVIFLPWFQNECFWGQLRSKVNHSWPGWGEARQFFFGFLQLSLEGRRCSCLLDGSGSWCGGILVRLVMHLFWGEKYKDLWFYTLFYIFILYLYSSWWK